MEDPPDFVYEPLAPTHIRLLGFEESPVQDELKFSLADYPRDEAPRYVALSYYWGQEPPIHRLIVNDKLISVKPTLWEALYHVTTEEEAFDKDWQYIWCDAVCIDQANIEEKNQQVREMYAIYSNAAVVVGWLGVDNSPGAFVREDHGYLARHEAMDQRLPQSYFEGEIFRRPYLYRIWIIQELFAARHLVLLIGRTRISTLDVWHWGSLLGYPGSKHQRQYALLKSGFSGLPDSPSEGNLVAEWMTSIATTVNDMNRARFDNLKDWLQFSSDSECSNPKDRIFALLSVLPTDERVILYTFFPDYALSLERIQLIVVAFLRHNLLSEIDAKAVDESLDLLRVWPQSLREELKFRSEAVTGTKKTELAQGWWNLTHPAQALNGFFKDEVADQAYVDATVQQLRIVASRPLSTELGAQVKLLAAKPWYVPES